MSRKLLAKKNLVTSIKKTPYLYILVLPGVLLCIVFYYIPMVGIIIAFQDYDLISGFFQSKWVGLENFVRFFSDPYFYRIIRNTILLNVYSLLFAFPAPIILALMLNEISQQVFKRVCQTISYLPHFISTVVVVGMIQTFLASNGVVNTLLMSISGKQIIFMMRPEWFRPVYISSGVWQTVGWSSIIYLAALSGVSPERYESAVIDGANRFQKMRYISIPSIMPVISILFILSLAQILTVGFEKVYLMYNPATYKTADVIATYLYRKAFESSIPEFGYSTAVGLFSSVVGGFFLIAGNALMRKITESSLW